MHRKRAIQLLLEQFNEIELSWDDKEKRKRLIRELNKYLTSLKDITDLDLPHLTALAKHINTEISLPHLYGLIVPIEREHSRINITDDHFVVSTSDEPQNTTDTMPVSVVLDNLRSAFNVGGIFRSSECLGIEAVHLCGYTATPDNFKVSKSALGTEKLIPWTQHRSTKDALAQIKNNNISIIALETASDCPAHHQVEFTFPCALLLGNERFGLSQDLMKAADHVIKIPTYGKKNSLNVVSAFTVCAYEIRKQWERRR
ncbi:MAG: RNA methyltransferase [Kiritimatiellae bacterium]|nr:RNA methyltransferase [Kiritimatiellia bacterium]